MRLHFCAAEMKMRVSKKLVAAKNWDKFVLTYYRRRPASLDTLKKVRRVTQQHFHCLNSTFSEGITAQTLRYPFGIRYARRSTPALLASRVAVAPFRHTRAPQPHLFVIPVDVVVVVVRLFSASARACLLGTRFAVGLAVEVSRREVERGLGGDRPLSISVCWNALKCGRNARNSDLGGFRGICWGDATIASGQKWAKLRFEAQEIINNSEVCTKKLSCLEKFF